MRAASSLALLLLIAMPAAQAQERTGVVSAALFASVVPDAGDKEVTVLDVRYAPGGINPRHFHPAAVTFHVLSGTPVFQEEGKPAITLKPGESLMIPAGTTHAHWNPSPSEGVRWLEFIVAEKGKGRAIRKP
jgi:quercetin dioxygenase-like cupin family protein